MADSIYKLLDMPKISPEEVAAQRPEHHRVRVGGADGIAKTQQMREQERNEPERHSATGRGATIRSRRISEIPASSPLYRRWTRPELPSLGPTATQIKAFYACSSSRSPAVSYTISAGNGSGRRHRACLSRAMVLTNATGAGVVASKSGSRRLTPIIIGTLFSRSHPQAAVPDGLFFVYLPMNVVDESPTVATKSRPPPCRYVSTVCFVHRPCLHPVHGASTPASTETPKISMSSKAFLDHPGKLPSILTYGRRLSSSQCELREVFRVRQSTPIPHKIWKTPKYQANPSS
ncbi:hypothetical protein MSAN_01762600 [Mycena sanguinolenta]|uniref:Uncharacterized protein n=1 Tax=Mycena sanguinolenta TaxID=230812 RepID=A0A8H7CS15_9AGAR|nr:hypothetical protein MSAN_01762600 [Mycena sanguinolenta]